MSDYYWLICFMNTLLSNVLTDLSRPVVVHVLFEILNSLRRALPSSFVRGMKHEQICESLSTS